MNEKEDTLKKIEIIQSTFEENFKPSTMSLINELVELNVLLEKESVCDNCGR